MCHGLNADKCWYLWKPGSCQGIAKTQEVSLMSLSSKLQTLSLAPQVVTVKIALCHRYLPNLKVQTNKTRAIHLECLDSPTRCGGVCGIFFKDLHVCVCAGIDR